MLLPFVGYRAPPGVCGGMLGGMNLLTITPSFPLAQEDFEVVLASAQKAVEHLDVQVLMLPNGMSSKLTHDPSALHDRLDRLAVAIEALAASNMALVERLAAADADESGLEGADPPWPAPMSRKG